MTLYEGKRFKFKKDSWIYEVIELANGNIKALAYNPKTNQSVYTQLNEKYFNDCDKLKLFEEC